MAAVQGPVDADAAKMPPPPAVASLRAQTAGIMERSFSENIREEREELREAAEQTLNVIVDLNLDGTIRWVSPSWTDVIGTQPDDVQGKPVADVIVSDNKSLFADTVESMKSDDSKSHRVRFAVALGPLSKLLSLEDIKDPASEPRQEVIDLEGQGIMVYDRVSGGESHTMWMIRPWTAPREIQIDLPPVIVDSLGSGAEVLASYLTQLAEKGRDDPEHHPPPLPVLCRICERQIPPWWFERHTDLCLQEHKAEMDVQMAQDGLTEHRHSIVRVLDALEVRRSRTLSGDGLSMPVAEYKGLPIGPPPSTQSSPSSSSANSRDRSGFGHSRARSFAIRRPQARIVELLVDLCDTAIEISTPAIKDSSQQNPGGLRTQSPQSESRISQVMQWQSPSTNTLEQEQGLAMLCADTETFAKTKVEAVFRHRKIIEYAERIRIEFACLVEDCIEEAMRKAAKIAAGCLSDSTEEEDGEEEEGGVTEGPEDMTVSREVQFFQQNATDPSALAEALQNVSLGGDGGSRTRPTSFIESMHSGSPRECPTPTSNMGGFGTGHATRDSRRNSRRESIMFGSEGGDSDGSLRSSSVASRQQQHGPRTDSPISEFGDLRRAASARQHQRRSLILPGTSSPRRQESPSRSNNGPASPLRMHKPRSYPFPPVDGVASPEASPMLPGSEFGSPATGSTSAVPHHRRQSSAAMSEFIMKPPPSPRLNAHNAPPQARPAQPSIKDFEIIKPISKGAFGSVYLSKKKSTGEYFAIKVLKKADMVAKNQVGNVKAERAIMMWQGQSEFVAKLYWTFSSKEYLYLVMEYLNGGDCASLIKVLGGLPEDWAKKYLGEVILGVEHLHSRGIIHRDLKPDNLLIDQRGHLKLTDFGLSRMGLVGRQQRALESGSADAAPDLLKQGPFARSASMASSRSTSLDLQGNNPATSSPSLTPQMGPENAGSLPPPSFFNLGSAHGDARRVSTHRSDSGGSESLSQMIGNFSLDSEPPSQPLSAKTQPDDSSEMHSQGSPDLSLLQHSSSLPMGSESQGKNTPPQLSMMPPALALFDPEDTSRRFVGTPDYLAPETIKGEKQNETSDWWSVGCIMFEFLYGVPPFHDSEAEKVFENILGRKIGWRDEMECELIISEDAKDLINRLLCMVPDDRLGSNKDGKFASGGEEIRNHAWFQGISWESLLEDEAQFVPQTENIEDTEYFDPRGATLQAFQEEIEDQTSPPSSTPSDLPDRPYDALSRVRSQVNNSIKRGLMPLHIPPHVRDHNKSRRLSEPVPADDFGNFAFKNLPVLEKANKDVIQKLRAEALAAQNKPTSPGGMNVMSPGPSGASLEGSPILSMPVQRTISNAKAAARPQSPSGVSHANSSPSRVSQPSSPLLVSFVAGQGLEARRKASSNSSSLSQQSGMGHPFDIPRVPPSLQKAVTSVASSPAKSRGPAPPPLALSPQKRDSIGGTPRHGSTSTGTRSRSLTVGSLSQEGSPVPSESLTQRHNRRSGVFDMSPSSSDNEGDKHNALLRVQRRRQSSRRLSQIVFDAAPTFRPLDVLICDDHPVSRMVMEKLLEKLRCRTISVANGSEAVRYSMSDIKFDIIFLEYRLPQINGADVARMIRETKNSNSHTPMVAITAYLKELQAPHYFDSLIEKPISSSRLTEVLKSLCQWKQSSPSQAASYSHSASYSIPHPIPSMIRRASDRADNSPTSSSSVFAGRPGSSLITSSREQSISSSLYGDSESVTTDDIPVVISRKATEDWEDGGLGIRDETLLAKAADGTRATASPPHLITQQSAPPQLDSPTRAVPNRRSLEKLRAKRESMEKRLSEGSVESADDEDEELGLAALRGEKQHHRNSKPLGSSKLGIEMMRANSHDSVTVGSESTIEPVTQVVTPSDEKCSPLGADAVAAAAAVAEEPPPLDLDSVQKKKGAVAATGAHTPPDSGLCSPDGHGTTGLGIAVDETPRPNPARLQGMSSEEDLEPTPRPLVKSQ